MTHTGWLPPDRGALFVVSGASGTGKTTLLAELLRVVPGLEFSVSVTTRAARPNETSGKHYHFVDRAQYAALRDAGALLEYAEVYGTGYGTPRGPVDAAIAAGRSVVLDIDVQGAAQVRAARPDVVTIFIVPPHVDVIRARLVARGTDTPEVIERRVRDAHSQLGRCGEYSYLVMNDDLATAHAQLQAIVVAELCRAGRRRAWIEAVGGVLPAA